MLIVKRTTFKTQVCLEYRVCITDLNPTLLLFSNGTDALDAAASCHPAAVEEFPKDLFTADQRESGAILVHVAAAVYLIIALGVSPLMTGLLWSFYSVYRILHI